MFKRTSLVAMLCVLSFGSTAWGEGRGFVGMDLGVMKPVHPATKNAISTGGLIAPYGGYMFNEYIGISAQLHAWGGKTKDRQDIGRFAYSRIPTDDNTTWVGGVGAGPIAAIPFAKRFSLWGTFQPGIYTALADEALTDTSFGFSTGAGLNIMVSDNFSVGPFGRYNRLYQRIHHTHDAKYVTAGVGLTYWFPQAQAAPPPAAVATPRPAAPAPPVSKKVVPRAVYFDFDKSNIRPDARATLDEAIRILKAEGSQVVIAEGHTDSRGTDGYNEGLSMRRARSVRDYLIKGGIPAKDIKTEGFGETKPVASNDTDEGRQQNRRVELRLMGK